MEKWTNLIENEWCFSFCTRIPIILEHLRYVIFMASKTLTIKIKLAWKWLFDSWRIKHHALHWSKITFFLLVSCIQTVNISFSRLVHFRLSRENIKTSVCSTHFLLQCLCKLSLSLSNSLSNAHEKRKT